MSNIDGSVLCQILHAGSMDGSVDSQPPLSVEIFVCRLMASETIQVHE